MPCISIVLLGSALTIHYIHIYLKKQTIIENVKNADGFETHYQKALGEIYKKFSLIRLNM